MNRRKRGREELPYAAVAAPPQQDQQLYFSVQLPPMLEPFPLQSETPSPIVSTGLHLALADQENNQIKRGQPDSVIPAYFSEELAAQINTDKNEIDQYLIAQVILTFLFVPVTRRNTWIPDSIRLILLLIRGSSCGDKWRRGIDGTIALYSNLWEISYRRRMRKSRELAAAFRSSKTGSHASKLS